MFSTLGRLGESMSDFELIQELKSIKSEAENKRRSWLERNRSLYLACTAVRDQRWKQ